MSIAKLRSLLGAFFCASALTVCALPAAADPIPVPVGTSPEQNVFLTFYSYSGPNPPPFEHVTIVMNFDGWSADDLMTFDFFDGQQGISLLFSFDLYGDPYVTFTYSSVPGLLDGQFSIGLRLASGAAQLTGSSATVWGPGMPYTVNGVVTVPGGPFIVPEPATLALLGVGLVGVSFSRRRQQR